MKRPRRGYALIEMLAVITAMMLIGGLCVTSLQGLMRAERAARRDAADEAALERLALAFRRDVHAARGTPKPESPALLRLELTSGRSVAYAVDEGTLTVTHTDMGGEKSGVETFRFRRWVDPKLERLDQADRGLLRLVFRDESRAGTIELAIEAVPGTGDLGEEAR